MRPLLWNREKLMNLDIKKQKRCLFCFFVFKHVYGVRYQISVLTFQLGPNFGTSQL